MAKKVYQKPAVSSEKMFEQAALGCTTAYGSDYDCRAKSNVGECNHFNIKPEIGKYLSEKGRWG